MASLVMLGPVFHDFRGGSLGPGESEPVFLVHDNISQQAVITITAVGIPVVPSAVCSLSVGDVALTREPVGSATVITAGSVLTNIGNAPIETAVVWISSVGL